MRAPIINPIVSRGKQMKTMLILLCTVLMATSALATIDNDPDSMGFYFDLAAESPCLDGVAPYATVDLYLILTNPSTDAVYGFEAGLTFVGNAMLLSSTINSINCINVGTIDNMIVGFGDPTMTTPATLLVTFEVLYIDTTMGPVDFYLHGSEPSSIDPIYPTILLVDGELQMIATSTPYGPSAQINGGCTVVATDHVSFDEIKSLYR